MLNEETLGLIIFAITALGAVYAFIFVLGGPQSATGQVIGELASVSNFQIREAERACRPLMCSDGFPGIPTGKYDAKRELYECKCLKSEQARTFYRSRYSKQFR